MLQNKSETRRAANQRRRKQQIIDAARELIAEGGMSALSMRKLASTVNLSVTTLYNLFGSSDGILNAVVDDALDRLDDAIHIPNPNESSLDHFLAILTAGTEYVISEKAIHRPAAIARYERLSRESEQERLSTDRAIHIVQGVIEKGVKEGQFNSSVDAFALAEMLFAVWERYMLRWAFQLIDDTEFRARSLYSHYIGLLSIAEEETRHQILDRLNNLKIEFEDHNFWSDSTNPGVQFNAN